MRMVSYKGEIEMKNILTNDFASELFDLSEDSIYNILEEFNENQNIDKTLTYVFIKAFYIHIAKVILDKENISLNFDEVYSKYRMYLSIYYKSNNSQISQELLNEILDAFDKSFAIIESLEFNRIEDSYEFRHHIIDSFELLRKILEKKSKCNIRTDIFDKYIADIQEQSFGVKEPFVLNMNVLSLTFAFSLQINIASIIGLAIAIFLYKKLY